MIYVCFLFFWKHNERYNNWNSEILKKNNMRIFVWLVFIIACILNKKHDLLLTCTFENLKNRKCEHLKFRKLTKNNIHILNFEILKFDIHFKHMFQHIPPSLLLVYPPYIFPYACLELKLPWRHPSLAQVAHLAVGKQLPLKRAAECMLRLCLPGARGGGFSKFVWTLGGVGGGKSTSEPTFARGGWPRPVRWELTRGVIIMMFWVRGGYMKTCVFLKYIFLYILFYVFFDF